MTEIIQGIFDSPAIEPRDTILLTSSMLPLLIYCSKNKIEIDMNSILDEMLEKIGPEGTLLLPVYNWDFCEGKPFSILESPGRTGSLGNEALKHPAFKRSKHPLYSWAIAGKDQELLCASENIDAFGEDSGFAYLHNVGAKNVCLNVKSTGTMTFIHYVEQCNAKYAPFRFIKRFEAPYIDENDNETIKEATMFVRDYDLDVKYSDNRERLFIEGGAVLDDYEKPGAVITIYDFRKVYDIIEKDLQCNKGKSYCTYRGQ